MNKKMGFKLFLAIFSLSIAGSVIFEIPYLKYIYYDGIIDAFGITNAQSGFMLSVFAFGCMIFYIPGGIIADKYPTKPLILISLFSTAALGVVLAFTMNYYAALVIYFLFSISASFVFWVALLKAIRLLGGKDNQGTTYGWYYALGGVIALVCSFVFLSIYKMHEGDAKTQMFWVIISMSIAVFISGVLVVFIYKENPDTMNESEEDKFSIKDVPKVLTNQYVWLASLLMFIMYAVFSCASYFTPFFTARMGMEPTESAFLGIIRTYALYFFSPLGGYIADKILKSTLRFYAYGFVVLAACYFGVLFIPADPAYSTLAIVVTFIFASFSVMMYGIMWSILSEVKIPTAYAGTAVGIASLITYMPDMFFHTIFGTWIDNYGNETGYFMIFLTLGILAVLAVFLSMWLAKKAKTQSEAKHA